MVFNRHVLYDAYQLIGGDFVGLADVDERQRASSAGRIPILFDLKLKVVEGTLDVEIVLVSVLTRNKPKTNSACVRCIVDASAMDHDVRVELLVTVHPENRNAHGCAGGEKVGVWLED